MKIAGRREYFGEAPSACGGSTAPSRSCSGGGTDRRPWPAHQRNVGEVRDGDLTLHLSGSEIVAVGRAAGNGRLVSGPPAGWIVDVTLDPLPVPVPLAELPVALKPGPPYPFTLVGRLQPGTCYPYPFDVAGELARRFEGLWPEGSAWEQLATGSAFPESGEGPVDGGEPGAGGDGVDG